jgi:hypothetical protein
VYVANCDEERFLDVLLRGAHEVAQVVVHVERVEYS